MQEKITLTEKKSRRFSVGNFLLNVKDLQVALAGGRADNGNKDCAIALHIGVGGNAAMAIIVLCDIMS